MAGSNKTGKKSETKNEGMLGMTFREVSVLWFESKKDSIATTTYDRYTDALNKCVYPEFENVPVKDITDAELERFANSVVENTRKEGKNVTTNTLQMSVGILSSIVSFARNDFSYDSFDIAPNEEKFDALSPQDIVRICSIASHNEVPEMLAAMLTLFAGLRMGEVCALEWKDVDFAGREIFVHQSVHRVRKAASSDGRVITRGTYGGRNKVTGLQVEEIPTKKHIRRVNYPAALDGYIRKFYKENTSVLTGLPKAPADARTMQNKIKRLLADYRIENINFQRLHKTYAEGLADEEILNDVFAGTGNVRPYRGVLDKIWLTEEMTNDLEPLRLLTGLSKEEVGEILGISSDGYRDIEDKKREMYWEEYLALLFLFDFNKRTSEVAGTLGLFPDVLKAKLRLG